MPFLKGQAEVTVSGGRGQGETRQAEAGHGAWGTLGRKVVAEGFLSGGGWITPAWGCHPWARGT